METKPRILYLQKILLERTDEENPLSTTQLINILNDEYGISAHRTTVTKDIAALQEFGSPADYILLDQGSGGTGQAFDWSLVGEIERPWFLAGGLSAENLDEAIEKMTPWAVDISSGVETDRKKDPEKVRKISYIIEGRQ